MPSPAGLIDPARTLAVTPIVGGVALKGPTIEMLRGLGRDASPTGVAVGYRSYATTFVLDHRDAEEATAIQALGYRVVLLDSVMAGAEGRRRLAEEILGPLDIQVKDSYTQVGGTARPGGGRVRRPRTSWPAPPSPLRGVIGSRT